LVKAPVREQVQLVPESAPVQGPERVRVVRESAPARELVLAPVLAGLALERVPAAGPAPEAVARCAR
jgi:hypothetical protein